MGKGKKNGQMVPSMKETTSLARKMDLEDFYGLISQCTKEIL